MSDSLTIFISLLFAFCFLFSCKSDESIKKEKTDIIYLILDKTSNYYSSDGGTEESHFGNDTIYLKNMIRDLFYNNTRNMSNSSLVVFCNYIDNSINGNKELFMKLPVVPRIDTSYDSHIQAGQIISTRDRFEAAVDSVNELKKDLTSNFEKELDVFITGIQELFEKSRKASRSDCKGAINHANKKLNEYFIDTMNCQIGNKLIIAFSDLVHSSSKTQIDKVDNVVIRPGYSSEVKYLEDSILVNKTTPYEFKDYLLKILKYQN